MRPLTPVAVAFIALLACKTNSITSNTVNGGTCGASTDCRTDEICGHDQMCHPPCSDAGTCPDPTNACVDGACYPAGADAGPDASTCTPAPNAGSGMVSNVSGTWEGKPIPQQDVLTRRGSGQMSGGSFTFYGSELEISFTSYAAACGYAKAGYVAAGSRIVDVHLILWNLTAPGPPLVAGSYSTDEDAGSFTVWIQVNTVDGTSCSAEGGAPNDDGPVQASGTITVDTLTDTYAAGTIDITAGSDTFKASYAAGDCAVSSAGPSLVYACCAP